MLYLIQNDDIVPAGHYAEHIRRREVPHQIIRADLGDELPVASEVAGAIVLGGYMSVEDVGDYPFLVPLQAWMRELTEQERPLLGICLGGQLLARATGGTVHRNHRGERGIHRVELEVAAGDDPLLACMPDSFPSLQWHKDSFDPPPGARLLASSPACPGQLFHIGAASYGLQFHPEADRDIIRSWSERAGLDSAILDRYLEERDMILAPALTLLDNFLEICGY